VRFRTNEHAFGQIAQIKDWSGAELPGRDDTERSNRRPPLNCVAAFLTFVLIAGCNPEKPPAPKAPTATASDDSDTKTETLPEITFRTVDRDGFEAVLAEHSGQVILVDYWAMYCVPCLERFPHLIEFAKTQTDRGLVVITLLCEDEPRVDGARAFLQKKRSPFIHLRSAYGSGEQTFADFKIKGGALPHYKLFDRQGKLRRTLATDEGGPVSRQEVEGWVLTLLAEKQETQPVNDEPAREDTTAKP